MEQIEKEIRDKFCIVKLADQYAVRSKDKQKSINNTSQYHYIHFWTPSYLPGRYISCTPKPIGVHNGNEWYTTYTLEKAKELLDTYILQAVTAEESQKRHKLFEQALAIGGEIIE